MTYTALYLAAGAPLPGTHLLPSVVWGLATVVLPWLILYPAFGWDFFGSRAPGGTRPLPSPVISHVLYGFRVGIVLSLAA